eukprot:5975013-Prymnesium_polylepis.2
MFPVGDAWVGSAGGRARCAHTNCARCVGAVRRSAQRKALRYWALFCCEKIFLSLVGLLHSSYLRTSFLQMYRRSPPRRGARRPARYTLQLYHTITDREVLLNNGNLHDLMGALNNLNVDQMDFHYITPVCCVI